MEGFNGFGRSLGHVWDNYDNNNQIQLMDSDLYCPLCNNEYSSDNMPRLLTACGHTYCHSCLDTMIIEGDDQYRLQCPEDSIVIYLKNNQITQFPKNIALIKLIESKKSNTSFKEQSSLEITKIQKNEDSRGNESEQEIINQIVSSGNLLDHPEENSKKESENVQLSSKNSSKQIQKGQSKFKPKATAKMQEEVCLVHQKPLQIVCMVDMQKICSKCAIFGQHRGHEFKSIDQIQQQCNILHEDILNIYNGQEDIMKQWNSINSKEILEILEVNKRKIVKEVSDRYKKLREAIMKSEEAMMVKIDETCCILEERIKSTLKIDENVLKEYTKFENESFGIIIKFEQSGLYEQKLRMLYDNTTTNLLFKGKDIIGKINAQHNNVFNEIEKIINSMKLEYNEEVFYSLDKFSHIRIEEDSSNLKVAKDAKVSHAQDESLLESYMDEQVQQNMYSNNDFALTAPIINSYSATFTESKPIVNRVEPKLEVKTQSYIKNRESSAIYEEQIEKIERPPKKKLKSIKVPEKVQKILQLLYNDTLDTLDLTNAELGDSVVLQICQFLRGTRVRTVKFIRNKLSDDAVAKMIASFGGVATLNLSQNFLTEQTLIHLANARNNMPALKTVILSQNKIIERKHKQFIERLKKLDLNVST